MPEDDVTLFGKLKSKLPFYVGGEDCFCLRRNPGGNFGALDRQAILEAGLTLMMASEPAIVAKRGSRTCSAARSRAGVSQAGRSRR